MESSEHKTSPTSLEKSSSTKAHPMPIQESSEKASSQLRYSSTMPIEFEQKKDNQAEHIVDSEERISQTDKKTSRKKLIRVASPQKEVSGEEYLQALMTEREDQLKKSLSKRIEAELERASRPLVVGEEEHLKKSDEGNELDQPKISKEKSVKKSLKKEEHGDDSSHPKIIEERPPSVKRTKSSSRKFVESDDEEDKTKENLLNQFKHASDEPKREMTPNLRRTESVGSKRKDVSQNASSLDSSAKAIPNQEHPEINKKDNENTAISKFLEEDIPQQTTIERKASQEENVLDTSAFGSNKKSIQPIQTAIALEENFLDTSAFGSKKKSIHKEEIKADDTMNDLEKKALELQGIGKPSLSDFIENSAPPELEENHEKPSAEMEERKEDKKRSSEVKSPEKEMESGGSDSKMKLEPQIEIGENLQIVKKNERSPEKKEKSAKKSNSGSSRKSSRLSAAKKAENFKIIVSPPPEDKEAQKRGSSKNKSPKRKSSLKPSSFNKDMNESQGERKSQNKSIVKFNEMIQISEIKNPVVYEDSPNTHRVTRSKFREIPEMEEKTDSHKSGKDTRSKHRDNNTEEKKAENEQLENLENKKSSRGRKREVKESEKKEEGEAISKKGTKSKNKSTTKHDEESSGCAIS